RALPAEQVQRHAAGDRRAGGRVAKRLVDAADVVAAGVGLFGAAAAEGDVDVPTPRPCGDLEHALHPGRCVPGLDLLLVAARPALDRSPAEQEQVRVRPYRGQVEAERVVRVERRYHQGAVGVVDVDALIGS